MNNIKHMALAPLFALAFLLAPVAFAEYAPQQQQTQQEEIDDNSLALYVEAATKVQEVREEFQQKIPDAETPEQAQELQQEALQEMAAAVESFGMTVDEYNQIANRLQTDAELRERLEGMN